MKNKISYLISNIQNSSIYIYQNSDNKTKFYLISSLKNFISKLDNIYFSILNKKLINKFNIFTNNIIYFVIILLLYYKVITI
jgi:hypothetical protein